MLPHSPRRQGTASRSNIQFIGLAAVIAIGAFMAGQRLASYGLDDGAEPANAVVPWRPQTGKCRHDYISIIAEGAASSSPPQLSLAQMMWIALAVRTSKPHAAPADFLVFGLGFDSAIWSAANCGGKTVFLENMQAWIDQVKAKIPDITVYKVDYNSKLDKPKEFFSDPSEPKMPPELDGSCFDVVLVDSPMGWKKGAGQPGRYQPVYYAINMARRCIKEGKKQQVTVFVHDAQRELEGRLVETYLTASDTVHIGQLNGRFGRLVAVVVVPESQAVQAADAKGDEGN